MEQTQTGNKKRVVAAAVAVAALLALIIGGVWAYLQDSTTPVENKFETNQVSVDLKETTGGKYNIVPGTKQTKDPEVTGSATLSAYVFVKVTDETDGLVSYSLADGWQQLKNGDTAVEGVYYREYDPSTTDSNNQSTDSNTFKYSVLKDNQVSYPASITNEQMKGENGNLKTDVKLTFQAYAIQKDPFTSAYDAWNQAKIPYAVVTQIDTPQNIQVRVRNSDAGLAQSSGTQGVTNVSDNGFVLQDALAFTARQNDPLFDEYKYYHADFVVSFEKDITGIAASTAVDASNTALSLFSGSSGSILPIVPVGKFSEQANWYGYQNAGWLACPLGSTSNSYTYTANTEIRLLQQLGATVNYDELVNYIKEFDCGVVYVGNWEGDVNMTIKLCLYPTDEPSGENNQSHNVETQGATPIVVGTYTYTLSNPASSGE